MPASESVAATVATSDETSESVMLRESEQYSERRSWLPSTVPTLQPSLHTTADVTEAGPSDRLIGNAIATYAVSSGTVTRIRFVLDSLILTREVSEPEPGPALVGFNATTTAQLSYPDPLS